MIIRLLLALVVFTALAYAFHSFKKQPAGKRKKIGIKLALYLAAGIVLLLIATGRVHWITAIFAGLVPFLSRVIPLAIRLMPFLSQLQKQRMAGRMSWGDMSTLRSRFLTLQLELSSGRAVGEVVDGPFAGRTLSELSPAQIQELEDFYRREDAESLRLLQAFLQHTRGGAQESAGQAPNGDMSRSEALAILGLEGEPSAAEVVAAHKKLMQRLHPDRGGSNYLAAKVNQAKDRLVRG